MVSGLKGIALEDLWQLILVQRQSLSEAGDLIALRAAQNRDWMWAMITDRLMTLFREDTVVQKSLAAIEEEVTAGRKSASMAVDGLLGLFSQ